MSGCATDRSRRIPLLLALAVLAGCNWNVGTVDVRLVYSAREDKNPLSPDWGVRRLRIRIEGADLAPRETEFLLDSDGRLVDVPVGQRVRVRVEALDHIGQTLSRGVSNTFETHSGTTRMFLFIGQRGQFSDPPAPPVDDTEWTRLYAAGMRSERGRAYHTASVLQDGYALVAGGTDLPEPMVDYLARLDGTKVLRTAERFDPGAGAFFADSTADCHSQRLCLTDGLAFHSASSYPGLDDLLFLGGEPVRNLAELFDPDSLGFSSTSVSLSQPRSRHAMSQLTDPARGLLVAGGLGGAGELLASVELFDPTAGDFLTLDAELSAARSAAVAVAYDGGVLVIGGWEQFEPWGSEIPTRIPSDRVDRISLLDDTVRIESIGPLRQARAEHTAVLVQTKSTDLEGEPIVVQNVLVCGGLINAIDATASCELIDPEKGTSELRGTTQGARWRHTATVLADGRVLIAGGFRGGAPGPAARSSAVILDPDGELRNELKSMVSQRAGHTASLLPNGMVLLVGGMADGSQMASTPYEIFVP